MSKKEVRIQSMGEEIANAISHGTGALLASAGTAVLIVAACLRGSTTGIVSGSIYGFSLIFLYLMSTLYHAFSLPRLKKVFQVFDHCSIYILILGTYVPICISLLGGVLGWLLLGLNILMAATGVTATVISVQRSHKLSMVLYLLMGWSSVLAVGPLLKLLPFGGFALLLGGGLCYTIGIFFYKAKQIPYMHSIWHLFVLGGSVLHYLFILIYIMLR